MASLSKDQLKQLLLSGTQLVKDAVDGRLSFVEFLSKYDNFYYYNALDGHEDDDEGRRMLAQFSDVVVLHRCVQEEIINCAYVGENGRKADFEAAGRIDAAQAVERLRRLTEKYGLTEVLERLQS